MAVVPGASFQAGLMASLAGGRDVPGLAPMPRLCCSSGSCPSHLLLWLLPELAGLGLALG